MATLERRALGENKAHFAHLCGNITHSARVTIWFGNATWLLHRLLMSTVWLPSKNDSSIPVMEVIYAGQVCKRKWWGLRISEGWNPTVANSCTTQYQVSMLSYANVHIYTVIMHIHIVRTTRGSSAYARQGHKHTSLHTYLQSSECARKDGSTCAQEPGVWIKTHLIPLGWSVQ